MEDKSTSEDVPRRPPAYGYPDDGDVPGRPEFVLLEESAYFADRDNATTASCEMRGPGLEGSIKVTFCTARPPRVSYWCVHATAFPHTAFAREPDVLATDRGLVLLRVILGRPSDMFRSRLFHYFLYDAGAEGRRPSLKHLPHPGLLQFDLSTIALVRHCSSDRHGASGFTLRPHGALLRHHRASSGFFTLRPHGASQEDHDCGDCNYVIAARRCGFGMKVPHELCLYHSETEAWTTKPVTVLDDASLHHHYTNKAIPIAIGGEAGVVAWVDLDRHILLCNVLAKTSTLRRVSLPPHIVSPGSGNLRCVRDIAVINGFFEFTDLQTRILPELADDDDGGRITFDGWKATKWSMKITESLADTCWHMDYEVDSSEIPESSLPKLQVDAEYTHPTFPRLHIGLPNLSLQDDAIIYLLAKIDYRDKVHTAWVLALDMRNKTIQGVAEFGSKRTAGLAHGCITARISKYLKVAPGRTRQQKRQGMRLLGSSSKKQHGVSMATNEVCFPGQSQECEQSQQDTQVKEGAQDMVLE